MDEGTREGSSGGSQSVEDAFDLPPSWPSRLEEAGVRTVEQLARADVPDLAVQMGIRQEALRRWVDLARRRCDPAHTVAHSRGSFSAGPTGVLEALGLLAIAVAMLLAILVLSAGGSDVVMIMGIGLATQMLVAGSAVLVFSRMGKNLAGLREELSQLRLELGRNVGD